jgi:anti-sigma-K factor RskA
MNDDKSTTPDATSPVPEGAERDLDRMLDLVAAPAPSETLRARLLRDFKPGSADPREGAPDKANRPRWRVGALAVAAALVLGIALGSLIRPGGTPEPVATTAPAAPASQVAATLDSSDDLLAAYEDGFDGESDDQQIELNFAEGAPDSAAFMLAALDLGLRANDPAPDGTESFEGIPLE